MSKPSIMVVEDEFIVAQDIMSHLEDMGYQVGGVVDSGEKAIQVAGDLQPDLVIMDIVLRGKLDGIEAARHLHEHFSIPVIFLTAFGDQALLDRAKSVEPFGYLIKPFNARELHSAVEIGLYRAEMEKRLRFSEKRFKTMAELLPTGVLEIDENFRVTFINGAGLRMLGVSYMDLEKGMDIRSFVPPRDQDTTDDHLQKAMAGLRSGPAEKKILRKDGSQLEVLADFAPMQSDRGTALINLTDMSHIRKLEYQLRQAQKMEAIGRLAGGIAHDFNNLLSVTLGYSEILKDGLPPEHPHFEGLKEIFNASERARLLVKQLLALGRKQVLSLKKVDINAVISDFKTLIRRIIGEDIELKVRLGNLSSSVQADITQLEQVLMNLAVNARDAMPNGGILTLETAELELDQAYASSRLELPPGHYIMLGVGDTGVGIDAANLERIFEPFFTTKSHEIGTGLGLSTVYGIVKQHHGYIGVYSEPGQGTVFKILLPACAEGRPPAARVVPAPKPIEGSATILLVEDDPAVLRMTGRILSASGYHVIQASNAQDAVALARKKADRIDLLLTDVIMPSLKGPQVYELVRESHPETQALYMSGYNADVVSKQGVLDEGLTFIEKPFSGKQLLRTIETLLAK